MYVKLVDKSVKVKCCIISGFSDNSQHLHHKDQKKEGEGSNQNLRLEAIGLMVPKDILR